MGRRLPTDHAAEERAGAPRTSRPNQEVTGAPYTLREKSMGEAAHVRLGRETSWKRDPWEAEVEQATAGFLGQ